MKITRSLIVRIFLFVFVPLLLGVAIYLFYRPDVWFIRVFQNKTPSAGDLVDSSFIKRLLVYTGPDFCWAFSFASAIFILNHLSFRMSHGLVFFFVLTLTLGSEIIQLFLTPQFTFSFPDAIAILIACIMSGLLNSRI